MHSTEGFVDLRVHGQFQGGHSDDSVWPSFTDIMTVVVMIFLMALVVILIRNVELVRQLRTTMEAERQSAEIARATVILKDNLASQMGLLELQLEKLKTQLSTTQEERDTTADNLAQQLNRITELARSSEMQKRSMLSQMTNLEQQLTDVRMQLLKSDEEKASKQQELEYSKRQFSLLQNDLSLLQENQVRLAKNMRELTERNQKLQSSVDDKNRELDSKQLELAQATRLQQDLVEKYQDLGERFSHAQSESEYLGRTIQKKDVELALHQQELTASRTQVANLEGSFTNLKQKYDRLVRPARSSVGRYIVDIRYFKNQGSFVIQSREPGELEYRVMDQENLEKQLEDLKTRYEDKLYTKIIIPENSGLSYNEAWSFTNNILNNYDYYYQR